MRSERLNATKREFTIRVGHNIGFVISRGGNHEAFLRCRQTRAMAECDAFNSVLCLSSLKPRRSVGFVTSHVGPPHCRVRVGQEHSVRKEEEGLVIAVQRKLDSCNLARR